MEPARQPSRAWSRAELALRLLAIDPAGLKGIWLRARVSPARDRLVATATACLPQGLRRAHPSLSDEALYGGTDLAATLSSGRRVSTTGLLGDDTPLLLVMAERCPMGLAARLGQWLDRTGPALIALDEGADDDELPPLALTERLGLFIDLEGIGQADMTATPMDTGQLSQARTRLSQIKTPHSVLEDLARTAEKLGINSARAPLMALAAARAAAALDGAESVSAAHLNLAAMLVFAHRATQTPDDDTADPQPQEPQDIPPPSPEPDSDEQSETKPDETRDAPPQDQPSETPPLDDMMVAAALSCLPADLLARLAVGRAARQVQGTNGTGAAQKGNRRGRPIPSRPGTPGSGVRIDPVATLRVAAPWQKLRRGGGHLAADRLQIRRDDIRVRQFKQTSDRLLIFAVDASGSAALARLAEAKGAVELLLAQAYARRDHVALVAFRGTGAELMLPPTRSLVQTKRRLAGLPGGGGTPLAAGLQLAAELALQTRRRGMTPTLALLTDGRANIALDGQPNRIKAMEEARQMARVLATSGTPALVIDTANRPQPDLRALADAMGAPYLPLPRADARRLSAALRVALAP